MLKCVCMHLTLDGNSQIVLSLEGLVQKYITFSYFCYEKKSNSADVYLHHNRSDKQQLLHGKIKPLLSAYLPPCFSHM